MSIGVISKWDLKEKKYPALYGYAQNSGLGRDRGAGTRSPLSSLKPTSTAGNPSPSVAGKWLPEQSQDCPDCQGEGCYTCEDWGSLRPDKGPKNDFTLNSFQYGEPMGLAFRLLKGSAPRDSLSDAEAANIIDGGDEETCPTCGSDLSAVFEGHPNQGNRERRVGGHSDMGIPDYEPKMGKPRSEIELASWPGSVHMPRKLPTGVKVRENPPRERIQGRMGRR